MGHPRFSGEIIAERGEELYQRTIRDKVETEDNIGKIISIDIETGDYEIDADVLEPGLRLLAKRPEAALYGKRIGYNAVFAVGGSLVRTA